MNCVKCKENFKIQKSLFFVLPCCIKQICQQCYNLSQNEHNQCVFCEKEINYDREQYKLSNVIQNRMQQNQENMTLISMQYFDQLKNMLNNQNLKLQLTYSGSQNGFKSRTFNYMFENIDKTIFIIQSEFNQIFGGYINQQINNNISIQGQGKSFLFSLSKNSKHMCIQNEYELKQNNNQFGLGFGCDLNIKDNCDQNQNSFSNLGWSYQLPIGLKYNTQEAKNYLAGSFQFRVVQIEIYQIID